MTTDFLKSALIALAFAMGAPAAHAMSDSAVVNLLKKNNCMKCHAPDRKKDGPSYKELAEKYRALSQDEARAEVRKHVTTFSKVEVKGKEENHEPLKTQKDEEIVAVVEWILSRP
jgi:cytochrome c